jgi:SNF2 family DNA or RNA helicase
MATPKADLDFVTTLLGDIVRPLLPHQMEFCAQAINLRGAYNASEQGTGKTAVALAMACLWCSEQVLIVCGKDMCAQWAKEAHIFWPDNNLPWQIVLLGEGSVKERILSLVNSQIPRMVMVNYEVLDRMLPDLIAHLDPDFVIFDEAWKFKNPKAAVTKAATELADRAGHVLCLAGTPIGQHAADLYSQLRLLGPELTAGFTWDTFAARFCQMEPIKIAGRIILRPKGVSDPANLMALLEPVWYRATKATCLRLPPQRDEVVRLRLPDGTRRLYHDVAINGEAALGCNLSLAGEQVIFLRLSQLAGGHLPVPSGIGASATWALEPMTDCPKIQWLKEFWAQNMEGDASVRLLVWTHYTHEADYVATLLNALMPNQAAAVHGKIKFHPGELDNLKASFNSRAEDGVRAIACTMDKMAFGHNLQSADHNVYFSLAHRHITHAQSRDRSHRLGRVGEVAYYYLLAIGTIDIDTYDALQECRDLSTRIVPDTVGVEVSAGSK